MCFQTVMGGNTVVEWVSSGKGGLTHWKTLELDFSNSTRSLYRISFSLIRNLHDLVIRRKPSSHHPAMTTHIPQPQPPTPSLHPLPYPPPLPSPPPPAPHILKRLLTQTSPRIPLLSPHLPHVIHNPKLAPHLPRLLNALA